MHLGLENKVAVVAASSKGLGKAVALGLAEEGARLTIFSRSHEDITAAAKEINEKFDTDVLPIAADVTQEDDINEVINLTVERYSAVHVLVNNSGGPPFGVFEDFSQDQWNDAIKLNLLSTINLTRLVLPYMKEQKWGRIVNITSIAVKQPIDGLILSNTSRAGVIGFAKTLSNEYAPYNILVNNVCPGRIMTNRIIHLAEERAKRAKTEVQDVIKSWESDIPVGRLGSPKELADLVVFLSSERASYITGTTIQVDGGAPRGLF